MRLWSIYNFKMKRAGDLSVSGLARIESGRVYSLAATNVPITSIQEALLAGYPDPPADQTLYFNSRGSESFDYAIDSVFSKAVAGTKLFRTEVVVRRLGGGVFPVDAGMTAT